MAGGARKRCEGHLWGSKDGVGGSWVGEQGRGGRVMSGGRGGSK